MTDQAAVSLQRIGEARNEFFEKARSLSEESTELDQHCRQLRERNQPVLDADGNLDPERWRSWRPTSDARPGASARTAT